MRKKKDKKVAIPESEGDVKTDRAVVRRGRRRKRRYQIHPAFLHTHSYLRNSLKHLDEIDRKLRKMRGGDIEEEEVEIVGSENHDLSLEELMEVKGIGEKTAFDILEHVSTYQELMEEIQSENSPWHEGVENTLKKHYLKNRRGEKRSEKDTDSVSAKEMTESKEYKRRRIKTRAVNKVKQDLRRKGYSNQFIWDHHDIIERKVEEFLER